MVGLTARYDREKRTAGHGSGRQKGPNLPKTRGIRSPAAKICEISAILGIFRVAFFCRETLIIKSTVSNGQTFHP
jgi:hypothetical protein